MFISPRFMVCAMCRGMYGSPRGYGGCVWNIPCIMQVLVARTNKINGIAWKGISILGYGFQNLIKMVYSSCPYTLKDNIKL